MTEPVNVSLDYAISTMPFPLQVSTEQASSTGVITVNVLVPPSAQDHLFCKTIILQVPVGRGANALYAVTPTAEASTGKWFPSNAEVDPAWIGPRRVGDTDYATFIFDCRDEEDRKIDYPLAFTLIGQINSVLGGGLLLVNELSKSDPIEDYTLKKHTFPLVKAEQPFFVAGFMARKKGFPNRPATEFSRAEDIELVWSGNATFYEIYLKGNATPVWQGGGTTATLPANTLVNDSTLVLQGTLPKSPMAHLRRPGQPEAVAIGLNLQTIPLTLTIKDPALTPSTLTLPDRSTLNLTSGSLTLTNGSVALANASVAGTPRFTNGLDTAGGLFSNGAPVFEKFARGSFRAGPKPGVSGAQAFSIPLKDALFTKVPLFFVTARHCDWLTPDTFAVSVKSIDLYTAVVVVVRVDQGSINGGWELDLYLDWIAFQ